MDIEDREHFKTIAFPSARRRNDSRTESGPAQSPSRPDHDWCLTKAKAIFGCYRRDEAHDPETFAAALAVVLSDYPMNIVEYAADPRTGVITAFPMGLPNIGQIKQFMDETRERQDRLKHYTALPKFTRLKPDRPNIRPNLFVPSDNRRYAEMCTLAENEPGKAEFARYVCADHVARDGIWVPLHWWEVQAAARSSPPPADTDIHREWARAGLSAPRLAGVELSRELADKICAAPVKEAAE